MAEYPVATLELLVRVLGANKIAYAIIGGVAVSLTASPRFTRDVDAVLWVPDISIEDFLRTLSAAGFHSRSLVPVEFAKKHRMILLLDQNGVDIDLSLGGLPFERDAVTNANSFEIEPGLTAKVASAEALVVMKAVASRPADYTDIAELLKFNPKLDRKYVLSTVKQFADLLDRPELIAKLLTIFTEIPLEL